MTNDDLANSGQPIRPFTRGADRGERLCPQCDYNLQGLAGPVVACPECGTHWDLRRLTAEWRGQSWYGCPGFGVIVMPAFVAGLGAGVLTVTGVLLMGIDRHVWIDMVTFTTIFGVVLVTWLWQMLRVALHSQTVWAVLAALGFHLIGGVYLASLVAVPFAFMAMFTTLLTALTWGGGMMSFAPLAGATVVVVVVLAAARWCESRIGRYCLREEQLRRARVEGPSASHLPDS